GQVRDFKVYEADKFQLTPELERLAKTKSGRQRQVRYNPNWQYLKEKAKGALQSPEGRYIYSKRKYDVEPVFGHLKNVFGMRRTHLRGKKKVETDVGIAFMMMNLSKYWNRRWSKDQSSLHKNKNNKKKTVKQLKLRVGLIVFWYLKVSFFPDTFVSYHVFHRKVVFLMKSLHSNILKLMDQIINQFAANIHKFTFSDQAFTRCRKLNVIDLIKVILNMGVGSLNNELLNAFPNVNYRMTASAFEQQKAKLKPECFKAIMDKLSHARSELKLLDSQYLVVAIDGSDFNQPFNPESENIFKDKDGRIYCQVHVNALYDVLNKLYLNLIYQPRPQMNEREAALTMLKYLDKQEQDFLVLMDRGYSSFNLIENCNRLKHCHYVIRTKASKGNGGAIKEIAAMPDHECDIDLSCQVTSLHRYYITHKDTEKFLHLVLHKKRHYKTVRSKNT